MKMSSIERRDLDLGWEIRDDGGDGRTLVGVVVPYATPTNIGPYVEQFGVGSLRHMVGRAETVKLLAGHHAEQLPIGRAISLTESTTALTGEFRVSKTSLGDDVLALIRDGAVTGLSVGFVPIDDAWSPDRRRVTRVRADLVEVSVTAFPAYRDAQIAAVRAVELRPPTPGRRRLRTALLTRP